MVVGVLHVVEAVEVKRGFYGSGNADERLLVEAEVRLLQFLKITQNRFELGKDMPAAFSGLKRPRRAIQKRVAKLLLKTDQKPRNLRGIESHEDAGL